LPQPILIQQASLIIIFKHKTADQAYPKAVENNFAFLKQQATVYFNINIPKTTCRSAISFHEKNIPSHNIFKVIDDYVHFKLSRSRFK